MDDSANPNLFKVMVLALVYLMLLSTAALFAGFSSV